jgi:hypothetical protein
MRMPEKDIERDMIIVQVQNLLPGKEGKPA